MKKIAAMLVLLGLTSGCTRSFQVYDVQQLKNRNRDYLFYALPRTVVTIDVPVTKTETPFDPENLPPCKDEDELRATLGLPEPVDKTKPPAFTLGLSTIATRSEPDPEAVYAINLRLRPFALTSGSFEMTEHGILTTQSISHEDKSIDAVLTVARVAAGFATGGTIGALTAEELNEKKGSECLTAAEDILKIRALKTKVLSDSIVREGATKEYTEFVLTQLEAIETALAAKFSGPTVKTVKTIRCELRPSKFDDKTRTELFRFAPGSGVLEPSSACNVPLVLRPNLGATGGTGVYARVASDGETQFATALKPFVRPVSADPRGFFYRVPATGVITIEVGDDVRARQIASVAQLGTITSLPTVGGAFVRKAAMSPTLSASGGLTKLTLNGEPAGPDAVKGLAGIVGSIHDARVAEAAADAASKDELAQLERKRKLLEQEKAIAELETALAGLRGGQ